LYACIGTVLLISNVRQAQLLESLKIAGYKFYQKMSNLAHPAPAGKKRTYRNQQKETGRWTIFSACHNCRWYLELENKMANPEYKMGYLTDILAVAPHSKESNHKPITQAGQNLTVVVQV
jgi:hypothetical protein